MEAFATEAVQIQVQVQDRLGYNLAGTADGLVVVGRILAAAVDSGELAEDAAGRVVGCVIAGRDGLVGGS